MTNKSPTADNAKELGFLEHLIELRDRLLRIVLSVGIVFLVLMPFASKIYTWFAEPLSRALPKGQSLISINPVDIFFIPYKLALLLAFLLALPYVLYQLWGFIAPGLYKHEKRLIVPLIASSVGLFYLGILFAYFIALPMIFNVLQGFAPENVAAMPDIAKYLDFALMMFVAFGVGFEAPIATLLVIGTGIASREDLAKKRPYVIVAAFVIGMVLTPPDVLSQVILAIPMWLLFELGLAVSKVFEKQIDAYRSAREAKDKAEQEVEQRALEEQIAADRAAEQQATIRRQAAAAAAITSLQAANAALESSQTNSPPQGIIEDDSYIFEEIDLNADIDETENTIHSPEQAYRPMSDEEMEAELARIDAEYKNIEQGSSVKPDAGTDTPYSPEAPTQTTDSSKTDKG